MPPTARTVTDGDRIFLTGGRNDVLRLYDDAGFAVAVPAMQWRERLARRGAFFRRRGIAWRQILAPEKLSVSGAAVLPAGSVAPGERLLRAIGDDPAIGGALLDPAGYLRSQQAKGYAVYPRTDSHWTALGAFSAFQWLMSSLGLVVDYAAYLDLPVHHVSYRGDLTAPEDATEPAECFVRRVVPDGIVRDHANAIVRLKERLGLENAAGLHVGSHVAFRHPAAPLGLRLMLFGSSFSDYRLECSLLTFCAALFFREVHFVWSASLDERLIAELAPDAVAIEMPERFLTTCPDDRFDVMAHAAQLVANWPG
jgi:hypothetical protein